MILKNAESGLIFRINHKKINYIVISLLLSFLIYYFVPLSIRPDVANYIYFYDHYTFIQGVKGYSVGFAAISWIAHLLSLSSLSFLYLILFFSILFKALAFYKLSDRPWLTLIIYGLVFFPVQELITIRVALAISVFLCAIPDIISKRPVNYFIKIIIATCIHYSAIIYFLMYFLPRKKISIRLYALIGIFIFLSLCLKDAVISYFVIPLAQLLPSVYSKKTMAVIALDSTNPVNILSLHMLFFLLFCLLMAYYRRRIRDEINILLLHIMLVGVSAFYILSSSSTFCIRTAYLLLPVSSIFMVNIIKSISYRSRWLYLLVMFFVFLLIFISNTRALLLS